MTCEVLITEFVAHPSDITDAYARYQQRIQDAPLHIVCSSPRPLPSKGSAYAQWSLRCESAYAQKSHPELMQCYELRSLVTYEETPDPDDSLIEKFFFEDCAEPTVYSASVNRLDIELGAVDTRCTDELCIVTPVFLAHSEHAEVLQSLYEVLVSDADPVAYAASIAECDDISQANLIGLLWVRDAQRTMSNVGDQIYAMGKTAWTGWILVEASKQEELQLQLAELIDATNAVAYLTATPW
ncbi:hypothetical protein [Corynebacterium diphtheriae]|uniref:hypothetical protein n=1 Tax=Corynebacterium diphtheriae TaxID=1717 RepID=UPI000A1F0F67|nr:hypothetical protein [Corynebacterium diphtheriae]OSQ02681.1 hypothetical protein B1A62_04560 [Corynebacterium diphtheriae]